MKDKIPEIKVEKVDYSIGTPVYGVTDILASCKYSTLLSDAVYANKIQSYDENKVCVIQVTVSWEGNQDSLAVALGVIGEGIVQEISEYKLHSPLENKKVLFVKTISLIGSNKAEDLNEAINAREKKFKGEK